LDGLVARERNRVKVILPIWHGVDRDHVVRYSPILADKLAVPSSEGLDRVVSEIRRAIQLNGATAMASRNHKKKFDILQDATANSSVGLSLEDNLKLLFQALLDSFTPLHLRILTYFDNPSRWLKDHGIKFSAYMGGVNAGLEAGLPELRGQRNIYDSIVQDLFNRGLLTLDRTGLFVTVSGSGILEQRTTELGKKFLKYIAAGTVKKTGEGSNI
jgi:hypothetical protein